MAADGGVRRKHGMILIVVAMHAVAADGVEVDEGVEVGADSVEFGVCPEIGGIRFRHAHHRPIEHVVAVDHADPGELARREVDELPRPSSTIDRRPHDRNIRDPAISWRGSATMAGTPIVENLKAAELDVGFLDVNPVVGGHAVVGQGIPPIVRQGHLAQQQSGRHEIAIRKALRQPAPPARSAGATWRQARAPVPWR